MANETPGARIEEIARLLLGKPNKNKSSKTQLRFGSNGSIAVDIAGPKAGQWYDHENEEGGGAAELIRVETGIAADEVSAWVQKNLGLVTQRQPTKSSNERLTPARRIVATYP